MYATLEKRNPKGKGHDGKKKTMDTNEDQQASNKNTQKPSKLVRTDES